MKTAGLAILLCLITLQFASAAPFELAPGSWELTTLLRNFSIGADGRHENESGGSGPKFERACVTSRPFEMNLYPGLKNPRMASHCKATKISGTSNLIDSVLECSARDGAPPYVIQTVVTAPTPKSFVTIIETTFLDPNSDGSISRSTTYKRGRWLKGSCGD